MIRLDHLPKKPSELYISSHQDASCVDSNDWVASMEKDALCLTDSILNSFYIKNLSWNASSISSVLTTDAASSLDVLNNMNFFYTNNPDVLKQFLPVLVKDSRIQQAILLCQPNDFLFSLDQKDQAYLIKESLNKDRIKQFLEDSNSVTDSITQARYWMNLNPEYFHRLIDEQKCNWICDPHLSKWMLYLFIAPKEQGVFLDESFMEKLSNDANTIFNMRNIKDWISPVIYPSGEIAQYLNQLEPFDLAMIYKKLMSWKYLGDEAHFSQSKKQRKHDVSFRTRLWKTIEFGYLRQITSDKKQKLAEIFASFDFPETLSYQKSEMLKQLYAKV